MNDERYVRIYYTIRTDPKFEAVYGDDAALAAWVRLLLDADAVWPAPASIPKSCRAGAFRRLVESGIVDALPGHLFRVHGLDAEREKRGQSGRNAAAMRWHSGRTPMTDAVAMPSPSSSPNRTESEQEQDDPVSTYYVMTTRAPRGRALEWCKRLGEQYGYRATSDAMSEAWGESDEVGTLLSRTEDKLVLASRDAERRDRAAELARLREKRERRFIQPEAPDPQKVADIMGELRERLNRPPEDAA
jgi:hypothetical protein